MTLCRLQVTTQGKRQRLPARRTPATTSKTNASDYQQDECQRLPCSDFQTDLMSKWLLLAGTHLRKRAVSRSESHTHVPPRTLHLSRENWTRPEVDPQSNFSSQNWTPGQTLATKTGPPVQLWLPKLDPRSNYI